MPDFARMRRRGRTRAAGARQDPVALYAFDLLASGDDDLRGTPLLLRKARLRRLIPSDHPSLLYVDHIEHEGRALYDHAIGIGLEGVVAKRAASHYVGGRSRNWLKSKPEGFHEGWKRRLKKLF